MEFMSILFECMLVIAAHPNHIAIQLCNPAQVVLLGIAVFVCRPHCLRSREFMRLDGIIDRYDGAIIGLSQKQYSHSTILSVLLNLTHELV